MNLIQPAILQFSPHITTTVISDNIITCRYSRTPLIRIANYPDGLGPSGKFVDNCTKLACLDIAGYQIKYRGADKSSVRSGRKQAQKHVRDARDFSNIEARAVIKFSFFFFVQGRALKEIHTIFTEALTCFLPGRAKDLSAPLYSTVLWLLELHIRQGRKVETQVHTVNSNNQTSDCQCILFSKKNSIIRIFSITG